MSTEDQGTTRKEFLTGTTAAAVMMAGAGAFGFTRPAMADHHESDERIIQIFRCKVDPEKLDEAKTLISELISSVKENEPDVLAYMAHHTDENDIVFFEMFKDQATMDAHGKQPYMAKLGEAFGSKVFLQPVSIEKLNSIAGFAR